MEIWEIVLIGGALSMDAFAVGMTNGMTEPHMKAYKRFLMAATYGAFQFLMPVLGYYCGFAFYELVKKIAPWLSFALLAFLGGKMIFDFAREQRSEKGTEESGALGAGKLLAQGVATSIDALAVGVTLLAAETAGGLPLHVVLCALIIGAVTLLLSLIAVELGRKLGNRLSGWANLVGGLILLAIGIKLLIEGLL